jgi:multidrug efflux pump subunit AcrA (membrane-fusion protein)
MRRALALALCGLAWAPAARAACPPVPAPPPPDAPASAAQIDAYVRAVARASPVISTGVAGLSVQGRPLRYAVA